MSCPIAVVGIGALFPGEAGLEGFWRTICSGRDCITEVPDSHWNTDELYHPDPKHPDTAYGKRGGFIPPVSFDPMKWGITPANLTHIDSTQLLSLIVTDWCLRDAGYEGLPGAADGKAFDRSRCGVILGVTGPQEMVIPLGARLGHDKWRAACRQAGLDEELTDDIVQRIGEQYVGWQENSFPGLLGNVVAGRVANKFDFGRTNCVVDAACASSFSAIHMAAMELAAGRSDMVISGGCDTFNDIFMYTCFSKTPALSPSGVCRTFDKRADGMLLGEGLGVVALKRLSDAEAAGDRIYCVLEGVGTSSDGAGMAVYAPSGEGQQRALADAYQAAGVSPDQISLYEAHGTGTKVGDATEIKALCAFYREHAKARPGRARGPSERWCAIGSVKAQIGHTKSAAGIAGFIKSALALRHRSLPPTINVDDPAEVLLGDAPVYINNRHRPWLPPPGQSRRAAISAFGFGGSNYHCVLAEHGDDDQVDWRGELLLWPLQADSQAGLLAAIDAIDGSARWADLRAQARAACQQPGTGDHRAALLLVRGGDHAARIAGLRTLVASGNAGDNSDGCSYGHGPAVGSLAFLFPGQGSQRCGMLADLACRFPELRHSLTLGDQAFGVEQVGERLSDRIHPQPVFSREAEQANEARLRDTACAQPALGAVELGATALLGRFGIKPAACAGHSFGELVALAAAGRISPADCQALATTRGAAMAAAAAAAEPSGMWACSSDPSELQALIDEHRLDLVLANRNTAKQTIVSGAKADGERFVALLGERGQRAKALPVAAAFHSRFVADGKTAFAAALAGIKIGKGQATVMANASGGAYAGTAAKVRETLAEQLVSPVRWIENVSALYDSGVRCFVEVGPGTVLANLAKTILAERSDVSICGLEQRGDGLGGLAALLGRLWSLGQAIDLSPWDASYDASRDPEADTAGKMAIALCGANQYTPPKPRPPIAERRGAEAQSTVVVADPPPPPRSAPQTHEPPHQPAMPPRLCASARDNTPQQSFAAERTCEEDDMSNATALLATQNAINALQQMQQQAAMLQQQYIQSQQQMQQLMQQMIMQQQALLGGVGLAPQMAMPQMVMPQMAMPQMAAAMPMAAPQALAPAPAAAPAPSAPAPAAAPAPSAPPPVAWQSAAAPSAPAAAAPAPASKPAADPAIEAAAQAAAAAAVQAAAAVTASQASGGSAAIEAALMAAVAEKTGYPVDSLELSMDLDADLGIDSIKRVEILSLMQERMPELPAVQPDAMSDLRSLGDIVDYLRQQGGGSASAAPAAAAAPAAGAATDGAVVDALMAAVAEKTGYPADSLELGMDLDADLGIDSIKRVEILSLMQERMPELPAVQPDAMSDLRTLGDIVAYLNDPK